ncbi:MAG: RibD family protein [Rubrivivax sp.]
MNAEIDADVAGAPGPRLWDAMLQVRADALARRESVGTTGSSRQPAQLQTLPADTLLHSHAEGWQPHPRCSAADRVAFAPHKAVLDANTDGPSGRAWLLAQLGQSLDGCIATRSGDSCFVTGHASLRHLHRLRALCDAVLVGAGTVAADNPQLTTRLVPGANAARLVLDPAARLDGQARLFHDAQAPTWWLCDSAHAAQAQARLGNARDGGATVLAVQGLAHADLGPVRLVQTLQRLGLRCVLVEGGGVTVSRLLAAGCLDRLHLVIAPVLIGAGRPGLRLPQQHALMAGCPRPPSRVFALGEDQLWDLDLQALRASDLNVQAAAP